MHRVWRYLRITIATLIGLLLLLLLLLFILSQIDINRFKETIETRVTEITGRQLILGGDIHLELSLHPALSIEKASFANAPWSDSPQMLTLEKLYLKIDLMPLFDKRLIVEQLLLEGIELSVETTADGQNNWQLDNFSSTEESTAIKETGAKPFQLPFLPVLHKVKLDTVRFSYDDFESDIHTDVIVEKLQLSNHGLDKAINFSANGSVNNHPFEFSGETRFLSAVTAQNIADQGLKIKADADVLGMTLTADGKIENPVDAEGIKIALLLQAEDLDKTFKAATGKSIYRYLRKSNKPLPLNLSANLTDIAGGYKLNAIKFNLAENDLNGNLSYFDRPDRPEIIAKLDSRKINLNQLLPERTKQKEQSDKTSRKSNSKESTSNSPGIELPDTALPFNLLKSLDADINLTVDELRFEEFKPTAIKLNASLKDGLLTVKQLDLNLDKAPVHSSLTIDSRVKTPRISVKLDIDNLQLGLFSQRLQLKQIETGTLNSNINLKTRGNSIKSLLLGLKGKADIRVTDVKLDLQIQEKTHNANIKQLKLSYIGIYEPFKYDLNGLIDNEPLLLSGELNTPASIIDNKTLNLKLKIAAFKINLEAEGSIPSPLNADHAKIEIVIDIPDTKASVRKISHVVPWIKPNKNLAGLPINIHGQLTASPGTYRFEKMQLKAGKNDLSGKVYADLRGKKPFIDAKLESRLIDLNELVPATILQSDDTAQTIGTQEDERSEQARLFSNEPLPAFDALGYVDINLKYNLKKLTSNNQVIDNIHLNLVLKDSLLKLDPLTIDFAKGTIKSKLELSSVDKPRFKLDTKITKLKYDRLMAILGIKEYARGELDAEINLTSEGNSMSALMANLDGTFRVTAEDGVLDNDSLKLLSKDLVSIIPFTDTSDRQEIKCAVVQFDINKGIASTHSMVINTGAISALGTGDIDLANETLDLYIAPRSKRTSVIKIALVPVNVTGPLSSPSVTPDVAGSTISTTRTATNISLTIATSGLWLLAEGFTNDLWNKFIDDTDYCTKALAGDKIAPRRIKLENDTDTDEPDPFADDDEYGGW